MVLFNYSTKELTAKVVYYGPGLCGKTTNLQWIHEKLPIRNKGKMLSLATEADRTLFFDFLPIELGSIRGMKTRIQLYTVPGQVFYNATRRMVLKGADCVVFVADSQEAMIDADLDSLANLKENLEVNEINPDEIPMVLQYNKRDLPNALPVEILNERLNPRNVPFFEAVAKTGMGVEETLKGATTLVFKSLAGKYGGGGGEAPGTISAKRPVPAPAAVPVAAGPATAPARPAPAGPAPPRPAAPRPAVAAAPAREDPLFDLTPAPPVRASDFQSTDDLLSSLDDLDSSGGGPSGRGGSDLDLDVEETVEELEVLPDDLAESPAPPERPGRTTLVKGPDESEDMRRKIARPSQSTDDALDELTMDDDQEISLEAPTSRSGSFTGLVDDAILLAPPPAPRPAAPAPRPPAPAPAPSPRPPLAAFPPPLPVSAPPAPRDLRPHLEAPPVNVPVEIRIAAGEHEVTVPIEVTVGRPGTPGHVRVHVALKIKVSG